MRYGLEKESKTHESKMWKLTMEAQIDHLKQDLIIKERELKICNLQLKELSEKTTENCGRNDDLLEKIGNLEAKLNQYLNSRPSPPINPILVPPNSVQSFPKQANNWQIPVQSGFPFQFTTRQNDSFDWNIHKHPKYLSERTFPRTFQPTPILENNPFCTPSMSGVSAMPSSCENWSPEELRWQHKSGSGTTLCKFSPSEAVETKVGFCGTEVIRTRMMNITPMPVYSSKSQEELRLEDYKKLKKPLFLNQKPSTCTGRSCQNFPGKLISGGMNPGMNLVKCRPTVFPLSSAMDQGGASYSQYHLCPARKPTPPTKWNFNFKEICSFNTQNSGVQTKEASTSVEATPEQAVTTDDQQPLLMQSILKELKGITDKFASLESRFTTLEGGISDISTRMSVMDAKFSSVDMFLTMERFDKKWNALESKLATLENPTVTIENNSIAEDKETRCRFLEDEEEIVISLVTKKNSYVESPEVFSFGEQSKEKGCIPFQFHHQIETKDLLVSNNEQAENSSTKFTDIKVDLPVIKKVNVSDEQNNLLTNQNIDKNISVDKMKTTIMTVNDHDIKIETSTKSIHQENQTGPNTPTNEINQEQKKPLAQSEVDGKSLALNQCKEKDEQVSDKTPPNEEDDFVVVDKSDFLNASEEIGGEDNSSRELHFPDVTEYLEVASIKKINRRYELGVEATDTAMLGLSADNSQLQMSLNSTEERNSSALDSRMSLGSPSVQSISTSSPSNSEFSRIINQATGQKKKNYFVYELSSSDDE